MGTVRAQLDGSLIACVHMQLHSLRMMPLCLAERLLQKLLGHTMGPEEGKHSNARDIAPKMLGVTCTRRFGTELSTEC